MTPKLRQLAASLTKSAGRKEKGEFGERLAKEWFERHGLNYFRFPQTPEEMPRSLARMGGKRPDFAVSFGEGESLVYMDAKFHQTNNVTEFVIEEDELAKFSVFRQWALEELGDDGDRDVYLLVYPQELNGDRFVFLHLEDLRTGLPTVLNEKPARKVLIEAGLWFNQDEGQKAVGGAND